MMSAPTSRWVIPTGGEYFKAEFGQSRSRGYQLLEAARVVAELPQSTIVDSRPNEAQARELARVPEEQRAEVWEAVVAGTSKPTAKAIREVAAVIVSVPAPTEPELLVVDEEPHDDAPRKPVRPLAPDVDEKATAKKWASDLADRVDDVNQRSGGAKSAHVFAESLTKHRRGRMADDGLLYLIDWAQAAVRRIHEMGAAPAGADVHEQPAGGDEGTRQVAPSRMKEIKAGVEEMVETGDWSLEEAEKYCIESERSNAVLMVEIHTKELLDSIKTAMEWGATHTEIRKALVKGGVPTGGTLAGLIIELAPS